MAASCFRVVVVVVDVLLPVGLVDLVRPMMASWARTHLGHGRICEHESFVVD